MEILIEEIETGNQNRPGDSITPKFITIHNTSNSDSGADAKAHSRFVRETGFYTTKSGKTIYVSWHFSVDDTYIINHLPENEMAFHAGERANNQSLAIEICMHRENNQNKANTNAAMLTAYLCKKHRINVSNIVPHKEWTGKDCPTLLLNSWNDFIAEVNSYMMNFMALPVSLINKIRIDKEIDTPDLEFKMCWLEDNPL